MNKINKCIDAENVILQLAIELTQIDWTQMYVLWNNL